MKNVALGISLAVLVGLGVLTFLVVGIAIGVYNTNIDYQTTIETTYKNNQNVLSQYSLKIAEAAQVPSMARDDLIAVIKEAIGGRYGENGSQATWQWIREHNPSVDPALYQTLQTMIEAGRNKFENAQTILLDQCAEYKKYRSYVFSGLVSRILGFPTLENLEQACTPIKSSYAVEAFETGIETGIKLR